VLAVGTIIVIVAGLTQIDRLFRAPLNAPLDFAAFWAAGHLAVEGDNPYDANRLQDAQAAVGLTDIAVIAWNPPWTLALVMPFGAVPFRSAYGLWALTHLGLLAASSFLLLRAFDGPRRLVWVPLVIVFTFGPTAFLMGNAQLTAVVLFGLAGFAAACRANRPLLAGAALALVATKPHLLIPFAVWFLASAYRTEFGRRVLFGALVAGALMCLPPALAVPYVWGDYFTAVTGPADPRIRPLAEWKPPLAGWWARQAVPGTPFWVQWLPALFAVGAVAGWCLKRHTKLTPDGALAYMPWLVGASLLVAPYGAWSYDLVLLLVPVLAVAVRLRAARDRIATAAGAACLLSANAVSLVMMMSGTSSEWYVWFAPCVLLIAWRLRKPTPPTEEPTPTPLPAGGNESSPSPLAREGAERGPSEAGEGSLPSLSERPLTRLTAPPSEACSAPSPARGEGKDSSLPSAQGDGAGSSLVSESHP
jgi:hypothetical protein